jgi:hypothetical protein
VTPAVTGSKTAIVAIGNADSQKLMNVRAGGWISVSVEGEMEKGVVDDVKEIGAEKATLERRYPNTHFPDRRSGRIAREGAGIG